MRILEEFWHGNIEPTEYDTSSCKEYKKLLELICRNEEKLKATMTDEQKELFDKYTDCVREHQTNTDCLIFQNGFKLGARNIFYESRNCPTRYRCTGSTELLHHAFGSVGGSCTKQNPTLIFQSRLHRTSEISESHAPADF